jgi:dethiobiotin synthetase
VSPQPRRLVVVTGTGTDIGKTWVTAALAAQMIARGKRVAVRKPAQSFSPGDLLDATVLGHASGEDPGAVCPSWRNYPVPMAPPMASEVLGLPPFGIEDLRLELSVRWPPGEPVDLGLIEGAGGVASPQAADGDMTALIAAVVPDLVVLVADAALGTINLVRLCVQALNPWPVSVHLNRFDPGDDLQQRNRRWLAERDGLDITTDLESLAERLESLTDGVVGGVSGAAPHIR